jgi:hypothetical protein
MSGEQRLPDQERRASARRGVRETHLQERRRKVAGDRRHFAHERRCSSASETTGGLRPPLLYCVANVCRPKKRFFRCTNARSQERRASARRGCEYRICRAENGFVVATTVVTRSGGRQPAVVFGKRTCRNAAVKSRETAGTLLTSAGVSAAPAKPRGAYAPRSCIALRTSVGEKTIFSMHKRTLTRAAGVSPPWV